MPCKIDFKKSMAEDRYAGHLSKIRLNEFVLSGKPRKVEIHYENEVTDRVTVDKALTYLPVRVIEVSRTPKIEARALDEYGASEKIDRIGTLKIDIDGRQLRVLKEAERLFNSKEIGLVTFRMWRTPNGTGRVLQ